MKNNNVKNSIFVTTSEICKSRVKSTAILLIKNMESCH